MHHVHQTVNVASSRGLQTEHHFTTSSVIVEPQMSTMCINDQLFFISIVFVDSCWYKNKNKA